LIFIPVAIEGKIDIFITTQKHHNKLNKPQMDDGDSKTNTQNQTSFFSQREKIDVLQRNISDVSNVLPTFWIRCPFQINNGRIWFILDSRYRFLFYFGIFLYVILFIHEILK
jgi:hypothetical protein